eukprot:gene10201-2620_t
MKLTKHNNLLEALPEEILIHIFTFNTIEEIVRLSETNQHFKILTKSNIFWKETLKKSKNFEDYQKELLEKSLNLFQIYTLEKEPNNFIAFCPFLEQSTLSTYISNYEAEKNLLKNIQFLLQPSGNTIIDELPTLRTTGKHELIEECWFCEEGTDNLVSSYLIKPNFQNGTIYSFCPKYNVFIRSNTLKNLIDETTKKLNHVDKKKYQFQFFDKTKLQCTDVYDFKNKKVLISKKQKYEFENIQTSIDKRMDFWFPRSIYN